MRKTCMLKAWRVLSVVGCAGAAVLMGACSTPMLDAASRIPASLNPEWLLLNVDLGMPFVITKADKPSGAGTVSHPYVT